MLRSFLLLSLFLQVDHSTPETSVAGILEMPEIFGDFPCDSYDPVPYEVFAAPSAEGEASPCEWIEVAFLDGATGTAEQIPFREFSYEQPGLVVLQRQSDWFRIPLGSGSGWILPANPEGYRSYGQLVRESLAYVKEGWTGELWTVPASGDATRVPQEWLPYLADELTVEVVEERVVESELWFKLRLDAEYGCGTLPDSPPAAEGWIPGHRPSGSILGAASGSKYSMR